jgi:hypothetical protein
MKSLADDSMAGGEQKGRMLPEMSLGLLGWRLGSNNHRPSQCSRRPMDMGAV